MRYLQAKRIGEFFKIKALYKRAFPIEERKPFGIIRRMQRLGKSDIWYFEEDGQFVGMAATINGEKEVLIDYLAVEKKHRGKGCGTRMITLLTKHYLPKDIFLEIEIPYEGAKNYDERKRRKDFYLRSGLCEMGTSANLFGVDMELLGTGRALSFDEYRNFYLTNYGKFAYDNIKKCKE